MERSYSIIAEPGGAAAFAAIVSGAYRPERNERVGVLVCGSNADLTAFAKTIAAGAASIKRFANVGGRLLTPTEKTSQNIDPDDERADRA